MVQFFAIIQVILVTGKQLQELHVEEEGHKPIVGKNFVHSVLLRELLINYYRKQLGKRNLEFTVLNFITLYKSQAQILWFSLRIISQFIFSSIPT